jgi:hypothetical protein
MNKNINYVIFLPVILLICVLLLLRSQFTNVNSKIDNVNNNFIYERFKSRFVNSRQGTPLPGVDCVYVITMPQRKEYISQQINNLGLNAVYFDAIKPQDIRPEEYNQLTSVNNPKSRIYGKYTRFAVLLSFLMCFIHSLENGYSSIVVFEDDIKSLVTLETLTNSITEFNKSNLDIFYMGYCFLNCRQRVGKNYDYLVELTEPDLLCCHSMCIKTHILPKLIDYCIPMTTNSDELFRDFYVKNRIKVCVPKSIYFTQNRKGLDSLNESIPDDELFDTCNFK